MTSNVIQKIVGALSVFWLFGCSSLWQKYPMETLPDFTCSTGGEAGHDVYVWKCLEGRRVVISQFCASWYPCHSKKREEVACGVLSSLEQSIVRREPGYPECRKKARSWQAQSRHGSDSLLDATPTVSPLKGKIVREYGVDPEKHVMNEGIDIQAAENAPVVATASGIVGFVGKDEEGHLTVTVDHRNGLHTTYKGLARILVSRGNDVTRGDVVGTTGRSPMHYEVLAHDLAVDPCWYILDIQMKCGQGRARGNDCTKDEDCVVIEGPCGYPKVVPKTNFAREVRFPKESGVACSGLKAPPKLKDMKPQCDNGSCSGYIYRD